MSILVSNPFGNEFGYHAAAALLERRTLSSFHTCVYNPFGSRRRWSPALKGARIQTHPLWEFARLASTLLPFPSMNGRGSLWVDRVARAFDRAVADHVSEHLNGVYCYEDSAECTFRVAQNHGVRRHYDLPIGHWEEKERIFREERDSDPSLSPYMHELREPRTKLERKTAEIALADDIICASTFTRNTVLSFVRNQTNVHVVPYGTETNVQMKHWSATDLRGPLKLLFVGILGPRKGLHYLFRALNGSSATRISLTVAGRWIPGFRAWLDKNFSVPYTYVGQVSPEKRSELYRSSHALVFPSLFEGFGLVILEAMACGIPILATERTGAPDIIRDNEHGLLLQAGSVQSISAALEWLQQHRRILPDMGLSARRVAERLTWAAYRERIGEITLPRSKALRPGALHSSR